MTHSQAGGRAAEMERLLGMSSPVTEDFREMFRLALEMRQAHPAEAERFVRRIADLARRVGHDKALCVAHLRLSELAIDRADYTVARELAEQVRIAAHALGERRYECSYHFLVGRIAQETGQFDSARGSYQRCIDTAREIGLPEAEHRGLRMLGDAWLLAGDATRALECYRSAAAVTDPAAADYDRVTALTNNALAQLALGHWEEATELLYKALALAESMGPDDLGIKTWAIVQNALAELAMRRDNLDRAAGLLAAVRQAEAAHPGALGNTLLENLELTGDLRLRRGDLAGAESEYTQGLALARQLLDRLGETRLHRRLAELALARGLPNAADGHCVAAVAIAESVGSKPELSHALRVEAVLLAARGDPAGARERYERALAALAGLPDGYERALVRHEYGRFLLGQGDRTLAREHLEAAAESFRRLGVVREAEEAGRLLMECAAGAGTSVALVNAVAGIAAMALPPQHALARVLALVCEKGGFEAGAIVVGRRALAVHGSPDLAAARLLLEEGPYSTSPTEVRLRLVGVGGARGQLYLRRRGPSDEVHTRVVLEALAGLLAPALEAAAALQVRRPSRPAELAGLSYDGVIGPNRAMREVLAQVLKFAPAGMPVLVCGESGSGKELVARALHESSPRAGRPFVAINCAAVPETLLEAELFGVEKGAATGVAARRGKFELAAGGTLFLDEIGDMSLALQAKLLRVLQDKQFERVGGQRPIAGDFRLVAATNQDLPAAIARGAFREDLYYRLNGVELAIPPLRERRDDVPVLAEYFVAAAAREFGRDVVGIRPEALDRLVAHSWPGNVRELAHVIERAVVLAAGRWLEVADLPQPLQSVPALDAGNLSLRELRRRRSAELEAGERERLLAALAAAGGNAGQAAKAAGYSRAQFYRLLKKHGITPGRSD